MIQLLWELHPTRMMIDASAGLAVLAFHGLFLALATKLLGDKGPSYDGRLTVDPTAHVDLYSMIALVVTQFGWIKPMDIRASAIRGGIFGILTAVSIALSATWALGQLVMASRSVIVAVTPPDMLQVAQAWIFTFTRFSDRVALFNLLPLLSLTAAHVGRTFIPARFTLSLPIVSALTLGLAVAIKLWVWR